MPIESNDPQDCARASEDHLGAKGSARQMQSSGGRTLSRRDLTSLVGAGLGALTALAATSCAGDPATNDESAKAIQEALSGSGTLKYADSVTELRSITSGSVGWVAVLNGYTTRGDGGGGVFYWDSTAAGDNGGTVINSGGVGSPPAAGWRRLCSGALNVKWFGATGNGTTDDTAAINATIGACSSTGGSVSLPPGTYLTSATINITTGIIFAGMSRIGTKIVNNTSDVFSVTGVAWAVISLQVSASAGNVFTVLAGGGGVSSGLLYDLRLYTSASNKSLWYQVDGQSYIDMLVEHCELFMPPNATVPGWYIVNSGGGLNSNTWRRCRVFGSSSTLGTQYYFFHLENSGVGNYATDNVLEDINGEACQGGVLRALSHLGLRCSNVNDYDTATYANDVFLLSKTANPGGLDSRCCQFINCSRRGGALGTGAHDFSAPGNPRQISLIGVGLSSGPVYYLPGGGCFIIQPGQVSTSDGTLGGYLGLTTYTPGAANNGVHLFGGPGAPAFGSGSGAANGDIYFRTDATTTANQRIYICTNASTASWTGIV